ncbi:hypothetical protein M422DRAFT_265301 [Sphaerobolus stellatus SS14]|uniref:Fungal lipase-type domain-containing protein n=1 Tax=Sphaerobolus stellatus (strain SS14) TaxID=990650 RepID=A0A0C9TRL2_SPHS4|nr:hypothetical protein M422DRAFT_265301 [Sphaerobolus stellatus SS14]
MLFPGITNLGIRVYNGFLSAQKRTALDILAATQKTLTDYSGVSVALVGHSLGGTIALLDALYLPLHLPSRPKFKFVGYGLPRVGNNKFAAYMDANFSDLTHINNQEDLVPILLGRFLGYHHLHGEVRITNDNTNSLCTVGDVTSILVGQISQHHGPYNGITTGTCSQ